MKIIRGIYYDGITSKPHEAILDLDNGVVKITVLSSGETMLWHPDSIEVHRFDNNTLNIHHQFDNHEEMFSSKFKHAEDYEAACKSLNFLFRDLMSKIFMKGNHLLLLIGLSIMIIFGLVFVYIIPYVGVQMAENTPISVEQSIGNKLFKEVSEEMEINYTQSEEIQNFYLQLHHDTKYEYKFYVIDDETMNAFALPGGYILLNTGMIKTLDNYQQLASLLYHEIGHIEHRHSLKSIYRTLSISILTSLLISDVSALAAVVVENSNLLFELRYSRELENEADDYSLQMLKSKRINVSGFVELFEKMEAEDIDIPEFLSTHPTTSTRRLKAQNALINQPTPIVDSTLVKQFDQLKQALTIPNDINQEIE